MWFEIKISFVLEENLSVNPKACLGVSVYEHFLKKNLLDVYKNGLLLY